jgi:glucose-1-phosphate thymidylyltransferase
VKVVLLAAGYATRLRPLTDDRPKHLLPVGGRPMLDWVLDRVRELDEVDGIHLVTNSRFAPRFEEWAATRDVIVHDDGTASNDDRRGAVGDLKLVIDKEGLAGEELLVLAGDNLFELSLPDVAAWWRAKPQPSSAVPLHDVGDFELATHYGIAQTDGDGRIVDFEEKPSEPASTLASTLIYLLPPQHVALIDTYLGAGHSPDNAGNFLGWLAQHRRVYGYPFESGWHDIGSHSQLLEADNWLRREQGLPERSAYNLD